MVKRTDAEEFGQQKAEIEARLREPKLPDVIPNVAEVRGARVWDLAEALADSEAHQEAAEGEVSAVLRGELMGILDHCRRSAGRADWPIIFITTAGRGRPIWTYTAILTM